MITIL